MIGWPAIFYGAALSATVALAAAAFIGRERSLVTLALVFGCSFIGPLGWNSVLHSAGSGDFFVDAPLTIFPVSWQDVGSGVWTLALASVVLGVEQQRARRATLLAVLTALAMPVDWIR